MQIYHFNLVDHKAIEDKEGQLLADNGEASDVADELARRLYLHEPDLREKGFYIRVVDERGSEIYRAAIRPAMNA